MLFAFCLLVASIQGKIPVVFKFRVGGVDPDQFSDLQSVVSTFLGVTAESTTLSDYEDAIPTFEPTASPTASPTPQPTESPTPQPTNSPTQGPTNTPTQAPSQTPTQTPTVVRRRFKPARRRRLSLDELYTLVYTIYVDDQEAADALIAKVQEMEDPETALAEAIATELGLDPATVIASPTTIEYKDWTPSTNGSTNNIAVWAIIGTIVILIAVVVFIVTYGPQYEHSEPFLFDEEEDVEETSSVM